MGTIVGWGSKDVRPDKFLNEMHVPIMSNDYCDRIFTDLGYTYRKHSLICAGFANRGIVPGDCGGPLQVEKDGVFYLVGITMSSFVAHTFRNFIPDVYIKVSSYCDFISSATHNEVHCLPNEYSGRELEQKCGERFNKLHFERYLENCMIITDAVTGATKNVCRESVPHK
uniref:Peptidase S1 domain-containing protein n=1 Tax=Globodera pallida TaxID=36090 RepID=A0A183CD56_GLOPA